MAPGIGLAVGNLSTFAIKNNLIKENENYPSE